MSDASPNEEHTPQKEPVVEFGSSFQGSGSVLSLKLTMLDFYTELKKQLDLTFAGLRY